MKTKFTLLSLLVLVSSCATAQKTVRVDAVKSNDYGVVYSLPLTSFQIDLLVKKTTMERGEFYSYAQRYLGVEDPIVENQTVFSLEDAIVSNKGIPDKDNSYMVEFRSKTVEPFVTLREDGVILAINAEPELEEEETFDLPGNSYPAGNARRYFTQETLMAGSTAKQAEFAARQIFDLRQNRTDILSGESENTPPDGNAYKMVMDELDAQEKALTELFAGKETVEHFIVSYQVIPEDKNLDRIVVARFSEKLGPVDPDNLAGEPIYFSLINHNHSGVKVLSEKELDKWEKKLKEGIVYNIPDRADLKLEFNNNILIEKEVDVVQFGTRDVLVKKMFDNNKNPIKIIFHPELGAIKQIIQ